MHILLTQRHYLYTHKYQHPHPHAEQQPVGFGNKIVQSVHGGSIGTAACGVAMATFVRTLSAFLSQLFLSHHLFLGGAMQLPSGNFSRNCRTMSGSLRHTPSSWLPRVILEKHRINNIYKASTFINSLGALSPDIFMGNCAI